MSVSKELYRERKNKNLCTLCGKATQFNKTLCLYHLQKANKNQQAVIARRRNKGLCPLCGQEFCNNRKICNKCLEKSAPNHKRDDIWIPSIDRKKFGLCMACGRSNLTSKNYCNKCSKRYGDRDILSRKQKIANGLCGVCGKGLLSKNKTKCIICIYKNMKWYVSSDYRQLYNEKQTLLRDKIIQYYGGKCACCSEQERSFLAIDHINGGGNKHRKKLKKRGANFNQWIINNNFPDDLQILCHNCNMSKYLLGGICAHKNKGNGV
jgi:hypothetical protein